MNRIFRLIWCKKRHMLVAVAEDAPSFSKAGTKRRRSRRPGLGRPKLTPLLGVLLIVTLPPGLGHALPTGGQVVAGQARISQSGTTMTVDQSTAKAILNWNGFGIGAGETVDFAQPSTSSIALNRVLGSNASAIYGNLNANGQVFLVNPNGIYFAPGAEVNVGGLVASTLGLSDSDFLSGTYHFSGDSLGAVTNDGTITTPKGGYVAFIGHAVTNDGTIRTPGGTTALGAGGSVDLTLAGDGLLSFKVSSAALKAEAANGGVIQADGGAVILSAPAKDALLDTVVNNTGVIRAQTVADQGGTIQLLGGASGTTQVAGTLDASAPNGGNGGQIETSGAHVTVADGATITTKAATGLDGSWLIDPADFTIAASGGNITGSALHDALGSNDVTIKTTGTPACTGVTGCSAGTGSNGDIFVDDAVNWSSHTLTLDAYRNIEINAEMNAGGTSSTAGLALMYGQGASDGVIGGVTSKYIVNDPVDLGTNSTFSTQLGSGGATIDYTIVDNLGAPGSTTGTDLQGINGDLSGDYVLGTNIDASATSNWNGGAGFAPIGTFTGVFDGLGHTITDLTIYRPGSNYVGLFGHVQGGTVRNVGLVGDNVTGKTYVGALVGRSEDRLAVPFHVYPSTVSNAYASGSVSGTNRVGGLVGSNQGMLGDAHATGSVTGTYNVGGLVGWNDSLIGNAYATGKVTGSGGGSNVGGLVGVNSNGTISNAYATGKVTGTNDVGGLIGVNLAGSIFNAYATGKVTGSNFVGGLVGNNVGSISDVYATGKVIGDSNVGGLIGSNSGTVSNAYWDIGTTHQSTSAGSNTTNHYYSLTDAQMMQSSNFYGFDFTTTWTAHDGTNYPTLQSLEPTP